MPLEYSAPSYAKTCRRLYIEGELGAKNLIFSFRSFFVAFASCNETPKPNFKFADSPIEERVYYDLDFENADLRGTDWEGAIFIHVRFEGADLSGANFKNVKFYGTKFDSAQLLGTTFSYVDSDSDFLADWIKARKNPPRIVRGDYLSFENSNMTGASLFAANLRGASFHNALMEDVSVFSVSIEDATFTPKTFPSLTELVSIEGLDRIKYDQPSRLLRIRGELKEAGYSGRAKEITAALRHGDRLRSAWPERLATLVLFELTCNWGASSGRPFVAILLIIVAFSVPYYFSMRRTTIDGSGIWVVHDVASILPRTVEQPFKIRLNENLNFIGPKRIVSPGKFQGVLWALLFSLLASTQIGWRDLQIAGLLERLNPNDYVLRASGWVRTLVGFQAIITVFLLALAVLSYFGSPFE
jgi:hypothetical protein